MEKFKTLRKGLFKSALFLGGLTLAGCSDPGQELDADRPVKVLEHEYHRPYMTILPAGKVMVPVHHPEKFHLSVLQCASEQFEPSTENQCVTAHISVSRETYNNFPNGSVVVLNG